MANKRSKNKCKSCGYTWYPKGKNLSRKCPDCGSREVTYSSGGCCGLIILLALIFGAISVFSSLIETNDTENESSTAEVESVKPNVEEYQLEPTETTTHINSFTILTELPVEVKLTKRLTITHATGVKGIDAGETLTVTEKTNLGYKILVNEKQYEVPLESLTGSKILTP